MNDSTRVVTLLDSLRVGDIAKPLSEAMPLLKVAAAGYLIGTAIVFILALWIVVSVLGRMNSLDRRFK